MNVLMLNAGSNSLKFDVIAGISTFAVVVSGKFILLTRRRTP